MKSLRTLDGKRIKPERRAKDTRHVYTSMNVSDDLFSPAAKEFRAYFVGLRRQALNEGNQFIASICGSVVRHSRITDKQAYCVALWQVNREYQS